MIVLIVIIAVLVVVAVALVFVGVRARSRAGELPGEGRAPTATIPAPAPPRPKVEAPPEAPPIEAPPVEAPPVAEPAVVAEPEVVEPEIIEKPRLRDRLGRTRSAISGYLRGVRGHAVDAETWDDLEEALLLADVGLPTTQQLLDAVRQRGNGNATSEDVVTGLRDEIVALLDVDSDRTLKVVAGEPNVWMFVGVNGVGKTTTIGKLAAQQAEEGRRVLLAAADTFRAAAAEQLTLWAERVGGEIVRGQEGADPGSIVFDAMSAASSRGVDLVLVDTAGRLHTKTNLMAELTKLRNIVDRTQGALKEVLLVIDASTGQNGLVQAREFADAVDVTGIVLTKLDGTAKGGIVLAIQHELGLPVKAVGVGEGVGDLVPFDPVEFADALFDGND